jgi:hypothetical protein
LNRPLAGVLLVGLMLVGLALAGIRACPVFVFTGIPCPGCGMVRAVLALCTFRFADAWNLHPLVYVAAPVGLIEVIYLAFQKLPAWKYPQGFVVAAIGAMLLVWAGRLATGTHPDPVEISAGVLSRAMSWFSR